ncbi:MAG: hypothetical protein WEB19_01585 [Acidimicrobiia bacterium]
MDRKEAMTTLRQWYEQQSSNPTSPELAAVRQRGIRTLRDLARAQVGQGADGGAAEVMPDAAARTVARREALRELAARQLG